VLSFLKVGWEGRKMSGKEARKTGKKAEREGRKAVSMSWE
jgi:hypothetical protein